MALKLCDYYNCLQIDYARGVSVSLGNVLTPTQVAQPPQRIVWDAQPNELYTLCMTGLWLPLHLFILCVQIRTHRRAPSRRIVSGITGWWRTSPAAT